MTTFKNHLLGMAVAVSMVAGSGAAWAIAGVDFASHSMDEAKAEIDNQNFEEAVEMLEEILRFEPENADAYNLLAYSQRNLGELDLAMENYNKALEIDPQHNNALEYQGELFLKLGDQPSAEKNLVLISATCKSGCEAYDVLQAAIERFKDGNFAWTQAARSN
ncbi:MAG: tetratricopeptide repeat protein [Rhodobacteraceae bacterium]|nr:tetratricopeptide repeat protein [Paracoccaceae bacterium]